MRACFKSVSWALVLSITTAAVLAGAGRSYGQQSPGIEEYNQALEAGNAALEQQDYEAAVTAFSQAITIARESTPDPYAGRAAAFVALKEYDAADKDFNQALTIDPEYVPALVWRGKMRLDLGATELALADFQLAVEQDRTNMDAVFGLGKSYVLLGAGDQGVRLLTRYLAQNDQNAEAYRLRGQGYAATSKINEAMQDIQKSLQIAPNDYETYYVLGSIFAQLKDYPRAVQATVEAVNRYVPDEDNPQPYIQGFLALSGYLVEAGKLNEVPGMKQAAYNDAANVANQLLGQLGDSPQFASARAAALFARAVPLRLQGKLGDAIDSFSQALELNPELGEAYFRRGICFYSMGEDGLAIADFQQAENILIDDPRVWLWEGLTQNKLGNYHEAIRAYGLAIAESDRYTPAYVNRGLTYMILGEHDKAIADFEEAIRLEPKVASHYFKRGVAQTKTGNLERAAESFSTAIELDDQDPVAHRYMADTMSALGKEELASHYRDRADELEATQNESPPGD